MEWLKSLFDKMLLQRVIGLASRKVIDFVVGALLATACYGTNICTSLAEWVQVNTTQIENYFLAAGLGLFTFVWSFKQKKKDVKVIKAQKEVIEELS